MLIAPTLTAASLAPVSQSQLVPLSNGPVFSEQPAPEFMSAAMFPPAQAADQTNLSDWPSEISSAMEWSIRFLDYPQFQ